MEKQQIQEDTKELTEKNNQLAEQMKEKTQALQHVEKYASLERTPFSATQANLPFCGLAALWKGVAQ